ncbi:MAG TPA: PBP1A family penicillin-binding protein [Candidatus Acidoferrales bacterium]|nr:PBP1A family penicillin-binding protein [Candidatus Acidoferrales bacterium]
MSSLLESTETVVRPARYLGRVVFGLAVLVSALVGALAGLLLVYSTDLPAVGDLERYRPNTISEVYDVHGNVIGSFALQRRVIATYDDYPKVLRDAVISIEDKDFEKHLGIDFWRIFGAAYRDISSGSRAQGASTLTMQLSRNLFLTPDRKFGRKLQEIMLAIQIERRFTKPQIFTLYANQIFLGHGVYGFEAGAQYYFSKHAKELTLEEAALLAGLPKGPSAYSPINNPDRAIRRRNLVINNMLEDGKITAEQAQQAKAAPLTLRIQNDPNWRAPYFVEEVRRYLEKKYGSDEVHERGLKVYTTLDLDLQKVANQALLDGLAAYERRHGWRGRLHNVIAAGIPLEDYSHPDWDLPVEPGTYVHAMVLQVTSNSAVVKFGRYTGTITPTGMAWTQINSPNSVLAIGDIVYIHVTAIDAENRCTITLEQDSGTQGALLAVENATGEVRAMVGGRDFQESKFNRATQALRQTGSSFKPYVYTAAVEAGAKPDDMIVDAPVSFPSGGQMYTPHNYDGKFEGTISLRRALADSRNIPAVKLAHQVGIHSVIDVVHRFGIVEEIPPYLPVALGSAEVTLLEQVAAYSTFPNDGVRIAPHFIRKVTDYNGRILEENYPNATDVVSAETARTMTILLREPVLHGTAYQASKLNHPLGGKTGTTNDFTDAWFIGFSPSLTCGVWVGFDEKKTLGPKETGAMAALPVWIDVMKVAIVGHDDEHFPGEETPAAPAKTAIAQTSHAAAVNH